MSVYKGTSVMAVSQLSHIQQLGEPVRVPVCCHTQIKRAVQTVVLDVQAVHWNYPHIPAMQQHHSCDQLKAAAVHIYNGHSVLKYVANAVAQPGFSFGWAQPDFPLLSSFPPPSFSSLTCSLLPFRPMYPPFALPFSCAISPLP